MNKTKRVVCIAVSAVVLAIVIALNVAVGLFYQLIDLYAVGYSGGDTDSATRAGGEELAMQIQEEGSVLLKNADETLPLKRSEITKVNVFGWASTDWIYSGSGSGRTTDSGKSYGSNSTKMETIYSALEWYGVEYNNDLKTYYESFKAKRDMQDALGSFNYEFSRLYEPAIDNADYVPVLDASKAYSNTALVVLSRITGESNDAPDKQYKINAKGGNVIVDDTRTYLEISTEEEALLEYVGKNFDKVIVLLNTSNIIELGFLDDIAGLDACLLVGTTGTVGAKAIPGILYGERKYFLKDEDGKIDEAAGPQYTNISPSGKTADTFAYDLSTNPTYATVGKGIKGSGSNGGDTTNFYTNSKSSLYPLLYDHGNASSAVKYSGVAYTDYLEGIYVGYKWYETADAEGFWTSDKAKSQWGISDGYQDVVQFPFGFGLSYAKFEWRVNMVGKVEGNVTAQDEISFQVTVKNISETYSGQDVVEVYYTPPYTANGVEKAAVNLVAFSKTTRILGPGDEQAINVSFKVSDMKSYDCYNLSKAVGADGGYVLEKGDYVVSLRTDAHTVVSSDVLKEGKAEYTYHVPQTIAIETDENSGNKIANIFTGSDAVDGVAIDGNSDGTADITYLKRSDIANTFPYALPANREMTDAVAKYNMYTKELATEEDDAFKGAAPTTNAKNGTVVYQGMSLTETGFALGDPANFNNDDLWDQVLDNLTISEMTVLTTRGYIQTKELPSIGKPLTRDLDGPNQIGSFNPPTAPGTTGFSAIVIAQTWNEQLAYSMGLTLAAEAANISVNGWYGPGVNIHRSPFGGRNWEYYSEDAYLSGIMSANAVKAAKNRGVYSYLKHLCLYESESGRDGMYNWLTEQALREVYVKPFEISVKVGGATGIMSSYGRIGAVWTGGSKGLLTNLLRDEWGFKGAVLTDYCDHFEFMNVDDMIRSGGDLYMNGVGERGPNSYINGDSNNIKVNLRRASKNIIYMWANALKTQQDYNTAIESGEVDGVPVVTAPMTLKFRWYIPVLVGVDVLAIGGCAAWIFLTFRKKKETVKEN